MLPAGAAGLVGLQQPHAPPEHVRRPLTLTLNPEHVRNPPVCQASPPVRVEHNRSITPDEVGYIGGYASNGMRKPDSPKSSGPVALNYTATLLCSYIIGVLRRRWQERQAGQSSGQSDMLDRIFSGIEVRTDAMAGHFILFPARLHPQAQGLQWTQPHHRGLRVEGPQLIIWDVAMAKPCTQIAVPLCCCSLSPAHVLAFRVDPAAM